MTDAYQSQSNPTAASFTTAITAARRAEPVIIPEAVEILEARGLDLELVSRLGVRTGKSDRNGDIFIEIPYYVTERDPKTGQERAVEVNTKSRTITGEKKFFQVKGGAKVFYNHQAIDAWQQSGGDLIICEGEFDCMTAMQMGHFAVSVPDGAPAERAGDNDRSVKYSYLDDFPKTGTVILATDGDDPGRNLMHDLADRIGRHRCKWLTYPKGTKDLNEVLVKYGEKGVTETLKRAKWIKVDGVYKMAELPPLPEHDRIPLRIVPITIRTSEMVILTGIPGHGKTTLLNHALKEVAEHDKRVIAIASFEQSPTTEHRKSLRTLYLGCAPHLCAPSQVEQADAWIDRHFVFIVPDDNSDEDVDLTWLMEKMAVAVSRYGASVLIIDPWNEIDHMFDRRTMSQTDYTGFAVKQLKKFARRYRVAIVVVAHPAKMKKERNGDTPIPNMYDIADSAHWANKADVGIVVHQKQGLTLCRLQKARYRDAHGEPGDYWLHYDRDSKKFTEAEAPKPLPPKTKTPATDAAEEKIRKKTGTKKTSMKDMLDDDEPVDRGDA
jgi:twinkle protein